MKKLASAPAPGDWRRKCRCAIRDVPVAGAVVACHLRGGLRQ